MAVPPALSVFMPVHQAARYLEGSVRSVLAQSFRDFELVALVNGCSDGSGDILRTIAAEDERVAVHEVPAALGTAAAAHEAIAYTHAPILARMDADDLAHPDRLARQWDVLRGSPDAVAVACLTTIIDRDGRVVRQRNRAGLRNAVGVPPFAPASVMMRRAAYDAAGGYKPCFAPVDDMDLLQGLAELGCFMVLPDALYTTRFHTESATASPPAALAARSRLERERFTAARVGAARPSEMAALTRGVYEREILRFWAGERPHVFGALHQTGLLRPTRAVVLALAKGVVGWTWPRGARMALRSRTAIRDRMAGRQIGDEVLQWRLR